MLLAFFGLIYICLSVIKEERSKVQGIYLQLIKKIYIYSYYIYTRWMNTMQCTKVKNIKLYSSNVGLYILLASLRKDDALMSVLSYLSQSW